MTTKIEEFDDKFVVTLEGDMDTVAADEAERILKPLYHTKGKDVFIECEKLDYIASSGLRILFLILKGAKADGSKVTLGHLNKDIMNVFKLVGFHTAFNFV